MKQLVNEFINLIYPSLCFACRSPAVEDGVLCNNCKSTMEYIRFPFCSICGEPVDGDVSVKYVCSFCTDNKPYFDIARSVFKFKGAVKEMIHRLKYSGEYVIAYYIAEIMALYARTFFDLCYMDFIISVPLYHLRQRQRTFNQAWIIAKGISHLLEIPFYPYIIKRERDTLSQTFLSSVERRNNVRGAFRVTTPDFVAGKRVILIDDVMTTGSTLNECAKVLKDCDAAEVIALTFARSGI